MSLEFVNTGDPIFDEISRKIYDYYPDACVIWIKRIINHELEEKYIMYKEYLQNTRNGVDIQELKLFHGTNENAVESICQEGFDVLKNKASLFGCGTYFAKSPRKSLQYAPKSRKHHNFDGKLVLYCDVLIGKYKFGSANKLCTVDDVDNFIDTNVLSGKTSIFVACHNHGAIPKYIVAFYDGKDR